MKDKLRIELASENRLGRDTFYAELDLPATAEQIKDAKQRARFTDDGDMIYRAVSILYFPLLPDLEHIRLDSTTVEELKILAQRLDSLPDEQFTIYQALFKQRFGDVDSDELLSVKDLINMSGSEKLSEGSKASSFCPTTTAPRSVNCTTGSASSTSPAPIRWHSGMKPERNSRSFSLPTTITTSAKTQNPSSSRCSTSTATRTTTTKKY